MADVTHPSLAKFYMTSTSDQTAEPAASLNLFASHFVRTALITRLQDLSGPPSQCAFGGGPVYLRGRSLIVSDSVAPANETSIISPRPRWCGVSTRPVGARSVTSSGAERPS